jgi:photosystem II stability/assembly factor-like uncharacterized protein
MAKAVFKPTNPLSQGGIVYTAVIRKGVKDLSGTTLSSDYTWSFTTEPSPGGGGGSTYNGWNQVKVMTAVDFFYGIHGSGGRTVAVGMNSPGGTTIAYGSSNGSTWTVESGLDGITGELRSVHFAGPSSAMAVGFATGPTTPIVYSFGGSNWTSSSVSGLPSPNGWLYGLSHNGTTWWTVGRDGLLAQIGTYSYVALSSNWNTQSPAGIGGIMMSIDFKNGTTGSAVGFSGSSPAVSTDTAGWNVVTGLTPVGSQTMLNSIKFSSNSNNAIAVGDSGLIYRYDGTSTWTDISPGISLTETLTAVYVYDDTHAWAVGTSGGIYFCSDITIPAPTWTLQHTAPYPLRGVYFSSTTQGWAVGDNGLILYTTNGGN